MERPAVRRTSGSHYRSYSRRSRSGKNYKNKANNGLQIREMLIMQCIVCGIILICVLIISLIDTPFTSNIRQNLKTAIASDISRDSLENTTDAITDRLSGAQDSIKSYFNDGEAPDQREIEIEPEITDAFSNTGDSGAPTLQSQESTFRIDEDILESIQGVNEEKKSIVPQE